MIYFLSEIWGDDPCQVHKARCEIISPSAYGLCNQQKKNFSDKEKVISLGVPGVRSDWKQMIYSSTGLQPVYLKVYGAHLSVQDAKGLLSSVYK